MEVKAFVKTKEYVWRQNKDYIQTIDNQPPVLYLAFRLRSENLNTLSQSGYTRITELAYIHIPDTTDNQIPSVYVCGNNENSHVKDISHKINFFA